MAGKRIGNQWRQGFVLTVECAKALEVVHPKAGDDPITIVVSHDCDLQAPEKTEPFWEVIPGFHIPKANGKNSLAKHPRILHLTISGGEVPTTAQFDIRDKRLVPRAGVLKYEPTSKARLSPGERDILQTWLSARYQRSAFADEFINRFAKNDLLYSEFLKIIADSQTYLQKVYFDVDGGAIVERVEADDAYSLAIYLVAEVENDPAEAEIMAAEAARKITALFKEHFVVNEQWQRIELTECKARLESEISLFETRLYREWQFDYFSLGDTEIE